MAFLEVEDGKRVYYEDYQGSGRPLVLVHGWGMSCRTWDYNLPVLREAGHRVVLIDHRACGRSDKDFTDVSIAAIAGDIAALVRELGLEDPVIVGWSLGCAASIEATEMLDGTVAGLALVGSPSPRYLQTEGWEVGGTPEAMAETGAALRSNRAPFLRELTMGVFKNDPGDAVVEWMWDIFMETSPNADTTLIALGDLDHRELLPQIEIPVLLCYGSADAIVDPATSTKAAEFFPNAKLVEFTESGHAPFFEEQDKFHTELLGFVSAL